MDAMQLFIPAEPQKIDEAIVTKWYENLFIELQEAGYSALITKLLSDPIDYYGLFLNKTTGSYYKHHFIRFIADCLKFIFSYNHHPRVLDIGCGCGSQSLLMAFLGAEVVGVDISPIAIKVCKERQKFYEKRLGKEIPVHFIQGDILDQEKEGLGNFDGVYSLFAWEHVEPQEKLIQVVSNMLTPGGRLALQNTNNSMWLKKILHQKSTINVNELVNLLSLYNIKCIKTGGTIALPKTLWIIPGLGKLLKPIDEILSKIHLLSLSYFYMGTYDPFSK